MMEQETLESQQLVSAALCLVGTIGLGATSDGSTNKGKPVSAPLALGTLACFAAVLGMYESSKLILTQISEGLGDSSHFIFSLEGCKHDRL